MITAINLLIFGLWHWVVEALTRYKMGTAFVLLISTLALVHYVYKYVRLFFNFRKIAKGDIKVRGHIEEFKKNEKGFYSPVVKFRTYSGSVITGEPIKDYSEREHYDLSEDVDVTYSESNPEIFLLEDQQFKVIFYIDLLLFIGLILFFMKIVAGMNPLWLNEIKDFLAKSNSLYGFF